MEYEREANMIKYMKKWEFPKLQPSNKRSHEDMGEEKSPGFMT